MLDKISAISKYPSSQDLVWKRAAHELPQSMKAGRVAEQSPSLGPGFSLLSLLSLYQLGLPKELKVN